MTEDQNRLSLDLNWRRSRSGVPMPERRADGDAPDSDDAGQGQGAAATSDAPSISNEERDEGGTAFKHARRIADDLGRSIASERLTPATGFPVEPDLCAYYGASRSVVRDAVKMLSAKGLLLVHPGVRTVVQPEHDWNILDHDVLRWLIERELSVDLLIEFTEMRLAIEPGAAALAASSATSPQRHAMIKASDRMSAAERGEDDPIDAEIAFQKAVIAASNNRIMWQFATISEATLRASINRTNADAPATGASAGDHRQVVDAILAGESKRASTLMRAIIEPTLNSLLNAGGSIRRG